MHNHIGGCCQPPSEQREGREELHRGAGAFGGQNPSTTNKWKPIPAPEGRGPTGGAYAGWLSCAKTKWLASKNFRPPPSLNRRTPPAAMFLMSWASKPESLARR